MAGAVTRWVVLREEVGEGGGRLRIMVELGAVAKDAPEGGAPRGEVAVVQSRRKSGTDRGEEDGELWKTSPVVVRRRIQSMVSGCVRCTFVSLAD